MSYACCQYRRLDMWTSAFSPWCLQRVGAAWSKSHSVHHLSLMWSHPQASFPANLEFKSNLACRNIESSLSQEWHYCALWITFYYYYVFQSVPTPLCYGYKCLPDPQLPSHFFMNEGRLCSYCVPRTFVWMTGWSPFTNSRVPSSAVLCPLVRSTACPLLYSSSVWALDEDREALQKQLSKLLTFHIFQEASFFESTYVSTSSFSRCLTFFGSFSLMCNILKHSSNRFRLSRITGLLLLPCVQL